MTPTRLARFADLTSDSRATTIGASRLNNDDGTRLDGVRALVVDDALYVLEVVTEILERDGATVTAVGAADQGGYWLIGQVRALPPERGGATPAAALSASASWSGSWRSWR
jgi:hypothetical protein